MADEDHEPRGSVECHVLRGADGSLYVLSEELLAEHRIPPEEAEAALEAIGGHGEVSGFASRDSSLPSDGQFKLVLSGSFNLKGGPLKPGPPTASTWWDIN